ncbi:MAG: cytidylate kinase family protein, partial [Chloroflexota bacterium]
VIANLDFRIEAAMSHHGLSREEAIRFIKKVDDERAKWTRFLYGVDWHDPSFYDIIINLAHTSLSSACEVVCCAINSEEFQPTPVWHKIMDDVVLSSHVRAMLASDESIGDAGIDVEAGGGVVTISGTVDWPGEIAKIETIVARIPGVRDFSVQVSVRPSWADVEGLSIR